MTELNLTSPPKRVLIIKPSAIGDIVHALPVLNLMRRSWPDAHIAWLVTPTCAGLLEGHPQLNEVIPFERRRFGKGWRNPNAAMGLLRFARSLSQKNFDLVVDLQGLFRSGFFSRVTRAPLRVGLRNARELAWIFYTHSFGPETFDQHAVDSYLAVARALGLGRAPVEFVFATTNDDRAQVESLTQHLGRYAVLLPGTNWPTKRWPVENYAALVQPLRDRFGLESIVAGGPEDIRLGNQIPGALNLAGKTSLRQLVALLEKADLVIANDTGPMHIAAALNRPLVTLYGPTNPLRTGPYLRPDSVVRTNIDCSPCYSRTCSHHSCLRWLGLAPILLRAQSQMQSARHSAASVRIGSGPPEHLSIF